ncbi:hypothetical protein ABZ354_05735 [Streptomyces sp. NPDC005925]
MNSWQETVRRHWPTWSYESTTLADLVESMGTTDGAAPHRHLC